MKTAELQELFNNFLTEAVNDKASLIALKTAVVKAKHYELAGKLRAIERDRFPESEEVKQAKEKADGIDVLLRMIGLNVPLDTCWLLNETFSQYFKKKGKFSLEDASHLIAKQKRLFNEESTNH